MYVHMYIGEPQTSDGIVNSASDDEDNPDNGQFLHTYVAIVALYTQVAQGATYFGEFLLIVRN